MTRPCRPCAAYAATAALYELPAHKVQPGRFRAVWPPRRLAYIFPQCREATVWTCKWHANGLWPISLYLALATETEDLTMASNPTRVSDFALDGMLAGKGTRVRIPKRMYGAWPGEDPAAVVAAYRETGSYAAAGRLLDKRGTPTRRAAKWQPQTVAWIVEMQGA